MDSEQVFNSYSPFIREFIYRRGWDGLHELQLEAARVIFDTDDDLLLSSGTATGKTEAALFPILSELYRDAPCSFGALYIAPLKSLINDQFERISELVDAAGIPVFHWHGDVSASAKTCALRRPAGILQITPESLEALLIRRPADIGRLFCDLRYVIIDELHVLMGTDRGSQILCQLARIAHATGRDARRVGLSATVGDTREAACWLSAGRSRAICVPEAASARLRIRLGAEHFFIHSSDESSSSEAAYAAFSAEGDGSESDVTVRCASPSTSGDAHSESGSERTEAARFHGDAADNALAESEDEKYRVDEGFEYVYDCVCDRKALVFSNSREETEYVTATLRQIAERRGDEDIFLIHHGNLSASLREEAEARLRDDDVRRLVTCATVTLELGVDIGRLERVVQLGAPNTVSSFLQRLGRSGRRGDAPEMMMVFREEEPLSGAPLPALIPWELLRGIAVIQLYIEERFIEPPTHVSCPYSLMLQQILSLLCAEGAMLPSRLAERLYSLYPFAEVPREDCKLLLADMINHDFLELTDEGELLVGLRGERLTDSYKFFAVFKDSEDFTVRSGSEEIGTISTAPPVGDRFALAGRVWEVEECDLPRRIVYAHPIRGKMQVSWPGDSGEIHTRVLERMRQVLCEDTEYPYLKQNALERLRAARRVARSTGMVERDLLSLGGDSYVWFPWLGTRAMRAARRFVKSLSDSLGISSVESESTYITFRADGCKNADELRRRLAECAADGIDPYSLVGDAESPVYNKYDPYVPRELLHRAYVEDRLETNELALRLVHGCTVSVCDSKERNIT